MAAHHAGMLPAFKEAVEELLRPRPGQGRVRHRDPGAGHQHAGPVRGAGAAGQVQRRGARRPDAGGVHPAHRPGRAPRHRRRGPRRGALEPGGRPAARGRPGVHPDLSAAVVVPAVVQHGGQPGRHGRRGRRPATCWSRRSPSSRRTGRWSAWPGRCSATSRPSSRTAPRRPATTATSTSTSRSGSRSPTGSARSPGRAPPSAGPRRCPRWRGCGSATSSGCRRAAGPGWPWSSSRPAGGFGEPRPLVLTQDRWAGRVSPADFPGAVEVLDADPGAEELQPPVARRAGATWPPRSAPPGWTGAPAAAGGAAATRPARRRGRRDRAAQGAVAPAPLPRLRGPGGTRPLGRAPAPAGARHRGAARQGRRADRFAGPHVRSNLIVPVPVHRDRAAQRGYDQALLLAVAAGRALGLPVVEALERWQATTAQFQLDRRARATNVAGAFRPRSPSAVGRVHGRWIVLVDDVMTTGATLSACAEVLLAHGAIAVSAVTVARER